MTRLRAYVGVLAVAAGVAATLAAFDLIDGFDLPRAGALAGGVAAGTSSRRSSGRLDSEALAA